MLFLQLFVVTFLSTAVETTFSGLIGIEEQYYSDELPEPTRQNDELIYFQPELDLKFNRRSRMHFKPSVRANISTDETPEQVFLNVQEAYWEIKTHPLRLRLGQNTYNWGVLDGYSTLDIVNGRVMFNPLQAERRGAPTVDIQYEGDWLQLQLLYIPAQARTLMPSADSRWLPRDVLINTDSLDQVVLLPPSFRYFYLKKAELDDALSNNYGARLTSRWNDFDFSLMFFEGSSQMPQFTIVAPFVLVDPGDPVLGTPEVIQATGDVGITPLYFRQRAVGGSIVWAPSDLILKLESTYVDSISKNPLISEWAWQNGVGIEYPWNIGTSSFTSVLQVYYGENKDPVDNMVSSAGRLFDRAAIFGTRWSLSTDFNCLFSFLYDYEFETNYLRLAMDYKFTDNFRIDIAGDFIDGDRGTFLGSYAKNDRYSLKLSYLW